MRSARAYNSFKSVSVLCPYCHEEHLHSEGSKGIRTADCLRGEYRLVFSDIPKVSLVATDYIILVEEYLKAGNSANFTNIQLFEWIKSHPEKYWMDPANDNVYEVIGDNKSKMS